MHVGDLAWGGLCPPLPTRLLLSGWDEALLCLKTSKGGKGTVLKYECMCLRVISAGKIHKSRHNTRMTSVTFLWLSICQLSHRLSQVWRSLGSSLASRSISSCSLFLSLWCVHGSWGGWRAAAGRSKSHTVWQGIQPALWHKGGGSDKHFCRMRCKGWHQGGWGKYPSPADWRWHLPDLGSATGQDRLVLQSQLLQGGNGTGVGVGLPEKIGFPLCQSYCPNEQGKWCLTWKETLSTGNTGFLRPSRSFALVGKMYLSYLFSVWAFLPKFSTYFRAFTDPLYSFSVWKIRLQCLLFKTKLIKRYGG